MTIIQKKVCMLGASYVGKTSLVRRFVESIFSEKYHATVGVKIDRKVVSLDEKTVGLMLWDLQGETKDQAIRPQYLRGASGLILVSDGTDKLTLEPALNILSTAHGLLGPVPYLLLINKKDLSAQWEFPESEVDGLGAAGHRVLLTSAKTGDGVEEAFMAIAGAMVAE